MKRQYKTYVCPKCGAGCVELPGLVHVCDIKKDEKKKDAETSNEQPEKTKKSSKKRG